MSRTAGLVVAALAVGGLSLVPAPAAVAADAGDGGAPACTQGQTQYAEQPSPALTNLAIPASWGVATGRGVTVAVVDSGINLGNRHFPEGSVVPGRSLVPGDTSAGRTDTYGHGTAVAGIIGARTIPGITSGMIGVARDAQLMPVRVFDRVRQDGAPEPAAPLTGEAIAEGIRWAVDNGADVVNVSLSVPGNSSGLAAMKSALQLAERRDVVVVAASGDNVSDPEQTIVQDRFPAAEPTVLGVSALNAEGVVDSLSIQGPHVDVSAPGTNVLVTYQSYGDCQDDATLTSWSAPFVAGLAAQLKERFPDATAEEIRYRITSTARRPVADQRDDAQGWGLIQPYEALTADLDERRAGPAAPDAAPVEDEVTASGAQPLSVVPDPLEPARDEAVWWAIGGVGLAAVALVLRPLVRRRVAGEPADRGQHPG